jgi:hypothetical protein
MPIHNTAESAGRLRSNGSPFPISSRGIVCTTLSPLRSRNLARLNGLTRNRIRSPTYTIDLLTAKRGGRIQFGGATGWNIAGKNAHGDKQKSGKGK